MTARLRLGLSVALALTACTPRAHAPPQAPRAALRVPIGSRAPAAWPASAPFGVPTLAPRSTAETLAPEAGATASATSGEHEADVEDADQDQDLGTCPASLDACPLTGCAVPGNGKARSNEIKHGDPEHAPPNSRPILVPIEVFADLQTAADHVMPQGEYPPAEKREALRALDIRGHTLGEGMLVEVTGYLRNMRAEGPESVNCKLGGVGNNDFHMSVVADPQDDEFHGIVVEMIPQDRPAAWNTRALHHVRDTGAQILVVGQLFYDGKHFVNPGPVPRRGQPKRFSLWEVHPVQRFFVCTRATCDPTSPAGWRELD